jgi:hypothetical protein
MHVSSTQALPPAPCPLPPAPHSPLLTQSQDPAKRQEIHDNLAATTHKLLQAAQAPPAAAAATGTSVVEATVSIVVLILGARGRGCCVWAARLPLGGRGARCCRQHRHPQLLLLLPPPPHQL